MAGDDSSGTSSTHDADPPSEVEFVGEVATGNESAASSSHGAGDEVEVVSEPGQPTRNDDEPHEVETATLEDVIFIDEQVEEPVLVSKHQGFKTTIKSIKTHLIADINATVLRKFCTKNGVKLENNGSIRKAAKNVLCERIIHHWKNRKNQPEGVTGNNQVQQVTPQETVRVNRSRLINVLFGDVVRPQLALRAKAIPKDDLTRGRKTGQDFYELVVKEYHSKTEFYGVNHFDDQVQFSSANQPDRWSQITWKKAKESATSLLKEYDNICRPRSGKHDDFDEAVAPLLRKEPIKSAPLLYLHEFVQKYPDALYSMLGKLPNGVFMESQDVHARSNKKNRASSQRQNESNFNMIFKQLQSQQVAETGRKNDIRNVEYRSKELDRKRGIEERAKKKLFKAVKKSETAAAAKRLAANQAEGSAATAGAVEIDYKDVKEAVHRHTAKHEKWLANEASTPDTFASYIDKLEEAKSETKLAMELYKAAESGRKENKKVRQEEPSLGGNDEEYETEEEADR